MLKGAKSGEVSIVGANCIVAKDISQNVMVASVPANIVEQCIEW